MDIWQVAYHLCGVTLLGKTEQEPLGALPLPVRLAVLQTAKAIAPEAIALEFEEKSFEYTSGTCCVLQSWKAKDAQLKTTLDDFRPYQRLDYPSVEAYFSRHNLLDQANGDEHYAERLFVEKVFVPILGLSSLSYLHPQVPFTGSDGKQRRIDFVIEGETKVALEVEGKTYHHPRLNTPEFANEKQRQKDLLLQGYAYYPITYSEIIHDKAKQALCKLLKLDHKQGELLPRQSINPGLPERADILQVEALLKGFQAHYQSYQKFVLNLLWRAKCADQTKLCIGALDPKLPLFAIALLDTIALLERVAELYGTPLVLPAIEFYTIGKVDAGYTHLLSTYLQGNDSASDKRVDAAHHQINFHKVDALPDRTFAYLAQPVHYEHHQLPAIDPSVAQFLAHVGAQPLCEAAIHRCDRHLLDYFARRYFRVAELKHEQVLLLQRALRQESGIGVLPTGFGKSIIFQLYALLALRTALVISPLTSLIRDQLYGLHKLGLQCTESITGGTPAGLKQVILENFLAHRYRLLYVSPERLQTKDFQTALAAAKENMPIGAIIIDEAHCVSEWGHDFRPAYLQIGKLGKNLEAITGRKPVMLGLTATASALVRQDIAALLGLDLASIVQLSTVDRPNLSLSVHTVEDLPNAKAVALKELIEQKIPDALNMPFAELLPRDQIAPYEHAGVVFAMYADPHGKTTLEEGVPSITLRLREQITFDKALVELHASKPPTSCPKCGSELYIKTDAPAKPCWCTHCNYKFDETEAVIPVNWQQQLVQRQDDFQANRFPLLAATKGYGMGIDKRNIRYVIHHALAGSLEGYYQEAGRAGRDGKQAHIALIYKPPTAHCYDKYLKNNQAPPCVAPRKTFQCPERLNSLCDAGRQAHFIVDNYKGKTTDIQRICDLYQSISKSKTFTVKNTDDGKILQNRQIDLYRLQQLGVIEDYSLKFQNLQQVTIEVKTATWQTETLAANLKHFLLKLGRSEAVAENEVAKLKAFTTQQPDGKDNKLLILEEAVKRLLEHVYEILPRMRYTMLGNLLRYAKSHERNECRRLTLRSTFDATTIPLDDYHCGFCDVCQADLKFGKTQAQIPPQDVQLETITQQLPLILDSFDVQHLPQIVQIIIGKAAVPGFYAKLSYTLEQDPTNLAALYLVGALACRQDYFAELGFAQLKFAYQEARRQGLSQAGLKLIYEEAHRVKPEEAFSWIDAKDGGFDTLEGLAFLTQEAEKIYGPRSAQHRNLHNLREVKRWRKLEKDAEQLAIAITRLKVRATRLAQPKG
ncbi:MAG: DEAD/DEAH box helicase [Caldilineaceae bacterium]